MPPLIGQQNVVQRLERQLRSGRVGHAYLFLGPSGSGKDAAARLLAQACNCDALPAPGEPDHPGLVPCGECPACRQIAAGSHPDVGILLPGSETGQNITAEQARELRTQVSARPRLGRRRFFLIPNAEQLHEAAANTLLKTLEEPPPYATLVLAAPGPTQVLPTIRSRCQAVRFGLAPPAELAAALCERFSLSPEQADLIARYSGGRPGIALTWARDGAELERRQRAAEVFARLLRERAAGARGGAAAMAALRLVEEARSLAAPASDDDDSPAAPSGGRAARLHAGAVLDAGLAYLRDLALLGAGGAEEPVHHVDRLPELRELAGRLETLYPLWAADQVTEAQRLLERNVTAALVLERLFLKLLLAPAPEEI